jgi:hypothetical protein
MFAVSKNDLELQATSRVEQSRGYFPMKLKMSLKVRLRAHAWL